MKNLNKADIVPTELLDDVIQSKKGSNKTRMEALKEDLVERYNEYCDKVDKNELHQLTEKWHYDKSASKSDGYFLYHQYDNSKKSMSDLRNRIIEENNGEIVLKCPICELRDATDLDHYAPRQLFPDFSVHSYNLIPICHECNNKKSTIWCDCGKRLFFNAYYDTPTDESLFDVNVKNENGILRMLLYLKKFENPKEATRIALTTIIVLDLMPYVNQKINEKFNQKLKEIIAQRKHLKLSDDDFLQFINNVFDESISETPDVNNWDRIVMKAINENAIVGDWLRMHFSR